MKICPVCHQTYADDNLNYCLNDGGTLAVYSDDAPPTVMFDRARTTQRNWENYQPPTAWQNQPLPQQQNQSYQPMPPNQPFSQLAQLQGQNQTLPTISLVLGIFAIVVGCCHGGIPLGAAALVIGYLGLKNANENPTEFGGRNLAIGGIITGIIGVLMSLVLLILTIAAGRT